MELKYYQKKVVEKVRDFLVPFGEEHKRTPEFASIIAWKKCGLDVSKYRSRENGMEKDLPTLCIKVPTGGGKTLLATQFLAEAYKTFLADRNGAGLVLWVVPSDQIYRDTLKALRDANHPYRQALEFSLSRRIQVWEKDEMVRLTPAQMTSDLNILLIKLQGAGRRDKSYLRFFRDSGGNIIRFFPAEDDEEAHTELKRRVPNLDMVSFADDDGTVQTTSLVSTSIGNLVRLCEPVVILDEGHKATSELARTTIEGFNPCLVFELSATPPSGANILCSVSGDELFQEEMIKMPINAISSRGHTWQALVSMAAAQRELLNQTARDHHRAGGKIIRPIVLVQVERTGKDKRDPGLIHSEDVREYLTQRLGIESRAVRVKTSEANEIADDDLMDENCPVEWIITKSALQEGWDCPFAYVLVSLNKSQNLTAMTQLVGRVLRQPFVKKVPDEFGILNEAHVFCLHPESGAVVDAIRKGLRSEGYEGEFIGVVDRTNGEPAAPTTLTLKIKEDIVARYQKPFAGSIVLPRFCVQTDSGAWEPMDYYRHLLSGVRVSDFPFHEAAQWNLQADLANARLRINRIHLTEDILPGHDVRFENMPVMESDAQAKAWMVANLNIEWLSSKQLRLITERVCENLPDVYNQLALVRFPVVERIRAFIFAEVDKATELLFKNLYNEKRIGFFRESRRTVFQMPSTFRRNQARRLVHSDNSPIQKDLFDITPDEVNLFERDVARFLDQSDDVFWWRRNMVARDEFSIQGYRRSPIYPDFIVQLDWRHDKPARLLIVESKGEHLMGNDDTKYKQEISHYIRTLGQKTEWQELEGATQPHHVDMGVLPQGQYSDTAWRDPLSEMLKGYEPTTHLIVK